MSQSSVYKPAKPIDKSLDSKLIEKAYSFALECHKSQKRHSGDPYISHPIAVADILLNLKLDTPTIITGLLYIYTSLVLIEPTLLNTLEIFHDISPTSFSLSKKTAEPRVIYWHP